MGTERDGIVEQRRIEPRYEAPKLTSYGRIEEWTKGSMYGIAISIVL